VRGGQAGFQFRATAEPQGGVGGDDRAAGQEGIGVAERDQGQVDRRDLKAPLDRADAGDVERDRAGVGGPFLPDPAGGTPRLEHQVPARAKRGADGLQGPGPVLVGEEDLGDVPGHHGQICAGRR